MKVHIFGSGSSGNCIALEGNDGIIMIDAGFSRKTLVEKLLSRKLSPDKVRCVLLTHDHEDHVRGARVFCDELGIELFLSGATAKFLRSKDKLPRKISLFEPGSRFELADFAVHPFSVLHDAEDTVGFVIESNGRRIGIATDLGEVNLLASNHLCDCDLLILESNYDEDLLRNSRRPHHVKRRIMSRHGHLSNPAAMAALEILLGERTRHLCLAHISCECNDRRLVEAMAMAKLRELNRLDVILSLLSPDGEDDPITL